MVIQNLKHEYEIIQKVLETDTIEYLLCKETGKELLDMIRIKERSLTVKLIVPFSEQMSNVSFKDFRECFSYEGDLVLVFNHVEAKTMYKKLDEEECVLKERLEIGKNLFSKIILLNMPDFLLYEALYPDNVMVKATMDVEFAYIPYEIAEFEAHGFDEVCDSLADLMSKLFKREIDLKIGTKIEDFVKNLDEHLYNDYLEIFHDYQELMEWYLDENNQLKPNTFWFKLWEKIKLVAKKIKPWLVVIIIFILLGYVLYLMFRPVNKPIEDKYDYIRIGNVEIQETEGE